MPYRLDPQDARCVQVQRDTGWQRLRCHPNSTAARAHLAALVINVEEATTKADMELRGTFSKLDPERRLAFGWASVAKRAGAAEPLVDRQGDVLDVGSLEDAMYAYVAERGTGGEMHQRVGVAKLVESFVVTPAKLDAMGVTKDALPTGVWVGFRVDDPATWERVKDGTLSMFSIAGRGDRSELPDA